MSDTVNTEPVVISHAVTVILGALVSAGWASIPDPTINVVGSILAVVLAGVTTVITRSKVTPTASLVSIVEGLVKEAVAAEIAKLPLA